MKNTIFAVLSIIFIIILIVSSNNYDRERKQKIREQYLNSNIETEEFETENNVIEENTLFEPAQAQQLSENWKRQEIDGVGFIDYPPTVEFRESKQSKYLPSEGKSINTQYIFQQKGLKDIIENGNKYPKSEMPEPLKKFVRIFVQTHFSVKGEYRQINSISPPSDEKIKIFKLFLEERENVTLPMYKQNSVEIFEWFPVETGKLNGMNYILISFLKQSTFNWEKQSKIINKTYFFENYDRMHRVTFEFRQKDKNDYESDFQKMIESFRIINISN